MLDHVALVRTDVSDKPSASFIRVRRIGELGTTLAATTTNTLVFLRSVRRLLVAGNVVHSSLILVTLMMEALGSSETSVLTRATQRNIAEDTILHSWRSVVRCTSLPIYPRSKSSRYSLHKRICGPQDRSEQHGEAKTLAPTGTQHFSHTTHSHRQSPYRLRCHG
jgi:hypothetical protein